jgi:hypothetical protein
MCGCAKGVDVLRLSLQLKQLQGKLTTKHCLAIFIPIYCKLQLRLSLWLQGAPRDPHLSCEQRSEKKLLRCCAAAARPQKRVKLALACQAS